MTVNELCSKLHLPSVVSHFGWDTPKIYRKLPLHGWYALSKTEDMTFNAVDLFIYHTTNLPKDDRARMQECYKYFTIDHKELFETPVHYSESAEIRIGDDYIRRRLNEKFYRACRAEALEGFVNYRARNYKFTKLLEEFGMSQFIHSGVGLAAPKIVNLKEFAPLCLQNKLGGDILLLPTFFAPNNRLASLEVTNIGDMSQRQQIYLNMEAGWYGNFGGPIVGSLKDLLTLPGCTWNKGLTNWVNGKVLTLHHSLQPNQCIEIWSNHDNIATDKDPLSLINKTNLVEHVKNNIGNLSINQIRDLEKATGQELRKAWLSLKTSETSVSGTKFISNNGKYYYMKGASTYEYTNFIVELIRVKKEDGEFYQYGQVTMNGETVSFRTKRKYFIHQHAFMKALTNITLEAGLGIPFVAPNLKHYITNVVDAFNPVNIIDRPKPAEPSITNNQNVEVPNDDL